MLRQVSLLTFLILQTLNFIVAVGHDFEIVSDLRASEEQLLEKKIHGLS